MQRAGPNPTGAGTSPRRCRGGSRADGAVACAAPQPVSQPVARGAAVAQTVAREASAPRLRCSVARACSAASATSGRGVTQSRRPTLPVRRRPSGACGPRRGVRRRPLARCSRPTSRGSGACGTFRGGVRGIGRPWARTRAVSRSTGRAPDGGARTTAAERSAAPSPRRTRRRTASGSTPTAEVSRSGLRPPAGNRGRPVMAARVGGDTAMPRRAAWWPVRRRRRSRASIRRCPLPVVRRGTGTDGPAVAGWTRRPATVRGVCSSSAVLGRRRAWRRPCPPAGRPAVPGGTCPSVAATARVCCRGRRRVWRLGP